MRTRLDVIHSNMIQRCSNPNHPYYGRYGGRERGTTKGSYARLLEKRR